MLGAIVRPIASNSFSQHMWARRSSAFTHSALNSLDRHPGSKGLSGKVVQKGAKMLNFSVDD